MWVCDKRHRRGQHVCAFVSDSVLEFEQVMSICLCWWALAEAMKASGCGQIQLPPTTRELRKLGFHLAVILHEWQRYEFYVYTSRMPIHLVTCKTNCIHVHTDPVMYVLTIHVFEFCDKKKTRFAERQSKLQYKHHQWTKCYKFIHHMWQIPVKLPWNRFVNKTVM